MRPLCFSLLPDGPEHSGDASPGVPPRPRRYRQAAAVSPRVAETLAADQDVRRRLLSCGPDALTPVETLTVLLVFQNPFGFFLPEETRGCSAWGRLLEVWRSDSAVKTDRPMEFHARLLVWFRAFGFLP